MIDSLELHALADGELSADERQRLELQLQQDAALKREYDAICTVKQAIRIHVRPVPCDPQWNACSARIAALKRTKRVEQVTGKYAWALCGGLAVFILLVGVSNRSQNPGGVPGSEIASATANLVPAGAPPSQQHAFVEQWLDGLLGQARRSISPERMQIVGAATGDLEGRRITRLSLRDASGDLGLIAVSGIVRFNGFQPYQSAQGFVTGKVQGADCIAWTDSSNTYVLIGSRSYDDLVAVAQTRLIQR